MTMNPEVFIRRNKLRRIFETAFIKLNHDLGVVFKERGIENKFHFRYSPHILDRAIQREIDEDYLFKLLNQVKEQAETVSAFLALPPMPMAESGEELDPNVQYRPLRLEVTDGNLWIGMTVDTSLSKYNTRGLCVRMGFVNSKRLPGKISTEVIKVN